MSRHIIMRKGHHILVQNGSKRSRYFTVINTHDDSHTHINCYRGKSDRAHMVLYRAAMGNVKESYPYTMKLSIFRIMDLKHQDLYIPYIKESDVKEHYKGNLGDIVWNKTKA